MSHLKCIVLICLMFGCSNAVPKKESAKAATPLKVAPQQPTVSVPAPVSPIYHRILAVLGDKKNGYELLDNFTLYHRGNEKPDASFKLDAFADFPVSHPGAVGEVSITSTLDGGAQKGPFWALVNLDDAEDKPFQDICASKPFKQFVLAWNADGTRNNSFGKDGVLQIAGEVLKLSYNGGFLFILSRVTFSEQSPVVLSRYDAKTGLLTPDFANKGTLNFPQLKAFPDEQCGTQFGLPALTVSANGRSVVGLFPQDSKSGILTWYEDGKPKKAFGKPVRVGTQKTQKLTVAGSVRLTSPWTFPEASGPPLAKIFISPDESLLGVRIDEKQRTALYLFDEKGRSLFRNRPHILSSWFSSNTLPN